MTDRQPSHYVLRGSGTTIFVKEADYFVEQGGLIEPWGKAWRAVYDAASIEEAHSIGRKMNWNKPAQENTITITLAGAQGTGKTCLGECLVDVLAEKGFEVCPIIKRDHDVQIVVSNGVDTLSRLRNEPTSPLPPFPELRSTWRHKNGNLYRVEALTNVESDRQTEYPTTIVYSNVENGKWYSRAFTRWHSSMTLEQDAWSTADQIHEEVENLMSLKRLMAIRSGNSKLIDDSPGGKQMRDNLVKEIEYVARGAALRAFQDGIKHEQNKRREMMESEPREEAMISHSEGWLKSAAEAMSKVAELEDPVDPLMAYLRRQWEWSLNTFGPAFRTAGIIQHIQKELVEVEKEPHDLMEWLDIVILALDGYWRHGGSPERALMILQAKQDKNFARDWPDWRTMSENQAIEHDRSKDAA